MTPKIILLRHGYEIRSLFESIGNDENDLTSSLAYVLSASPKFLNNLIKRIYKKSIRLEIVEIRIQEFQKNKGFTDIEISINNQFLFIIEAKKGWSLPSNTQVKKYLSRFRGFKKKKRLFIVLSDCSKDYFKEKFKDSLYGTKLTSISWREIIESIKDIYHHVTQKEKHVLEEFKKYLEGEVLMENKGSNLVYVVSLSKQVAPHYNMPGTDIVEKNNLYFYPMEEGGFPKIPPKYVAFRYNGKLQAIYYVKSYEVVSNLHKRIPQLINNKWKKSWGNYYLLHLSDKFEPRKDLPTGSLYPNGRVWCEIDTLFTAKTIKEASEITKKRREKYNV
jgi:hypothetical protein